MSLLTGFGSLHSQPISSLLCFVFVVEDVISQLPALGACCHPSLSIMDSPGIISQNKLFLW